MTCEMGSMTGAFAVHALGEPELGLFAQHLTTCAECADEVRGLQSAAAELSLTAAVEPPPQLRGQILSAIGQVRPLASDGDRSDGAAGADAASDTPVGGSLARDAVAGDNVVALRPRRRSRFWPATAAACVVVAVAASAWGQSQRHQLDTSAAAANRVYGVLTAPDAQTVSASFGAAGRGTVINSKRLNRTVLVADGIADPGTGRTYELWRVRPDGAALPAGTFNPTDGRAVTVVTGGASSTTAISVTIERAGGVAVPTTQAVLSVRL
jgi:hypothetical protein